MRFAALQPKRQRISAGLRQRPYRPPQRSWRSFRTGCWRFLTSQWPYAASPPISPGPVPMRARRPPAQPAVPAPSGGWHPSSRASSARAPSSSRCVHATTPGGPHVVPTLGLLQAEATTNASSDCVRSLPAYRLGGHRPGADPSLADAGASQSWCRKRFGRTPLWAAHPAAHRGFGRPYGRERNRCAATQGGRLRTLGLPSCKKLTRIA
jgi:hypothetical protein